ncbi:TPA: galactose-3-O-sulfotransferase 1 [Bos taurus]|nr:TPA: galactose-3-O-sulfotransferase 1 [Bos taurus]
MPLPQKKRWESMAKGLVLGALFTSFLLLLYSYAVPPLYTGLASTTPEGAAPCSPAPREPEAPTSANGSAGGCQPRRDIVFMKTHKTASSTLLQHPVPLRPEARAQVRLPQRPQRLRLPRLLRAQPGAGLPARGLLQHHLQPHALPLRRGAGPGGAQRHLHHRAARPRPPLRVLLPLLRLRGALHVEALGPRQAGRVPAGPRPLLRPPRLQRPLPPQPALLRPGLRQRPGPQQPAGAGAHPGGGAPLPPGAAAGVLRRVARAAQGPAVLGAGGRALLQAQRPPRLGRAAPLGRAVPARHGLERAGRAPLPPLQRQLLAQGGGLRARAHGPRGGRPAARQRAHAPHLHRRRPRGGRGGHPGLGHAALAAAGRQVHPGLQPQEEHRAAACAALPAHAHAGDPVPDGPGRQPVDHQALEVHPGLPAVV